jgi:hypothetical protein
VTVQPLEAVLADPPIWKDARLKIDLRLVNNPEFPIFLPHTPVVVTVCTKMQQRHYQVSGESATRKLLFSSTWTESRLSVHLNSHPSRAIQSRK